MLARPATGTPQSLRFFMIAPVVGLLEYNEHGLPPAVACTTAAAGFFVMAIFLLLERFDRGMTAFRRRWYRVALLFEALALPPIIAHQGAQWFGLFLYPAVFFALVAIENVDRRAGPSREVSIKTRRSKRLVADAPIDVMTIFDERDAR